MRYLPFVVAVLLTSWAGKILAQDSPCVQSVATVFRTVSPAVVLVGAISINPYRTEGRVEAAIGSGVIFDGKGLVLTNSHIVFGAAAVYVSMGDDRNYPAKVLGADPILDLAVLELPMAVGQGRVAAFGDSDSIAAGQEVVAIGNAFGLERSVTQGIVSGVQRVLPLTTMSWQAPFIQIDAAINPGSSGGPLVDRCGQIVGINTLMLRQAENIGFAIPINTAKEAIPQLIEHGRIIRPWYGIYGKLVDFELLSILRIPLHPGFLIETIEPGSPAEKIGLRQGKILVQIGQTEFLLGGDIITEVNDIPLADTATLVRLVRSLKVGDMVKLKYFRDDRFTEVEVLLPERPILPSDMPQRREPIGR